MRILLFNPSTGYYTRAISNPLGLLCIASFLKKEGHEVKLVDRCVSSINIKMLLSSLTLTLSAYH